MIFCMQRSAGVMSVKLGETRYSGGIIDKCKGMRLEYNIKIEK